MKRNLLFVMNNLTSGGAEKSLISLLEMIDYSLVQVDLLLFKHEGLFFSKIPKQVHLLDEPTEYKYFDMPIQTAVLDCLKNGKIDVAISRIFAGYIFKTEKVNSRCGQRVWKYISKSLKDMNKQYDAAIGYLEGYPIYFCIDNVKAKKKVGFIHTDYDKLGFDFNHEQNYFDQLDHLITVSDECANTLRGRFPLLQQKIQVMYNILSPTRIRRMSEECVNIDDEGLKLVSVGRLTYVKGFDLAIEACRKLVDSGYDLKWYIIGEGEERPELERIAEEYHLQGKVVFLGIKENPYPYMKKADVYVQPSRIEGKSIAIDEAKILGKPIVVTNFQSVKDQIIDEQNGLIVNMNAESIAEGIRRLIDDRELRENLIRHLSHEVLGTESEIEKIYELLH